MAAVMIRAETHFYRARVEGEAALIVEALDQDLAADVYAFHIGSHPFSINCSCCGPIGAVNQLLEEEVLEAMEDGYPRIITFEEFTAAEAAKGRARHYHAEELYR